MSHTVRFNPEGPVEDRLGALEKHLESLQLHKDSRRGLDGVRGPAGENSVIPGPSGPAGKDADITEAVQAAKAAMEQEFGTLHKFLNAEALAEIIDHRLIVAGVIDENKQAILVTGPTGATGVSVVGAKGDSGQDGVSVIGPRGRDAKITIGSVLVGETAAASLRESENGQVLDLVLPRGEKGETGPVGESIRGEKGEPGQSIEGPQGIPGPGLSKSDIVNLILDMKNRKSI